MSGCMNSHTDRNMGSGISKGVFYLDGRRVRGICLIPHIQTSNFLRTASAIHVYVVVKVKDVCSGHKN